MLSVTRAEEGKADDLLTRNEFHLERGLLE